MIEGRSEFLIDMVISDSWAGKWSLKRFARRGRRRVKRLCRKKDRLSQVRSHSQASDSSSVEKIFTLPLRRIADTRSSNLRHLEPLNTAIFSKLSAYFWTKASFSNSDSPKPWKLSSRQSKNLTPPCSWIMFFSRGTSRLWYSSELNLPLILTPSIFPWLSGMISCMIKWHIPENRECMALMTRTRS